MRRGFRSKATDQDVKKSKPKKKRLLPLMSLDDLELRTLSKRANERIRRLERYQKEHGDIITPAYEQAMFYLEGKKGKPRFKEWIFGMSEEQKEEQRFMVTAFLNNPLSTREALAKRQALKEKVVEASQDIMGAGATENDTEPKGLFEKTGAIQPETQEEEDKFWLLFDKAKEIGLMKSFDYRTIAKAISWKLTEKTDRIFRRIAQALFNIQDEMEEAAQLALQGQPVPQMTRREFLKAIRDA